MKKNYYNLFLNEDICWERNCPSFFECFNLTINKSDNLCKMREKEIYNKEVKENWQGYSHMAIHR